VRQLRPLLLAVPAAFVLTACGSDGESGSATSVDVAHAAAKTVDAGSARVEITGSGPGSFTGEGEFARDRGRLAMHFEDEGEFTPPGDVEMIFADGAVYMSLDAVSEFAPPGVYEGKTWLKIELDSSEASDFADFTALFSGDPTRILRELGGAEDFQEVGREEVRDVEATRYRGTIDGDRIDVWIGDDGLVRRFEIVEESSEDGETTTLTTEFYDFGAELDVEPPPADEVATMDEFVPEGL
jgi:hypothetical protein